MNLCFFVSDLHGKMSRYEALMKAIRKERPDYVFIGGDLLPHKSIAGREGFEGINDFILDFLFSKFLALKKTMDCAYPDIFIIPGNDDQKSLLQGLAAGEKEELWTNLHNRRQVIGKYKFYGYACVPPTPFRLKDWEKFDVSWDLKPGCIAPADGIRSVPSEGDPGKDSIDTDLASLAGDDDLSYGVFLFHTPPFGSNLDLASAAVPAADHAPAGVHVGSAAVQRFIEARQPYITLHGHVHESARLTGSWRQQFGRTFAFSAAHDGPELALVRFELHTPGWADRELI